jgi:NADPH:quinone reductase-like Zn-dependent oxidoreductase
MRRWILKGSADTIEGLQQETVDMPEPGPGQVRVRMVAASLNYREQLVLSNPGGGWRTDKDLIAVADGAGVIDAVGPGAEAWAPGDRVVTVYLRDFAAWPPNANIGMGLGSLEEDGVLAEYVILAAERVTRAPASLTLEEAATLPCAALTAWTALQQANPVVPGQTILALGSGGVSLFATSFAKALGAKVFVTSSKGDKLSRLIEHGASEVFDYKTDENWGQTIFDATGGIDKVVNTAGLGSLNQSLKAMAYGGDVAVVGLMTFGDVIDPAQFLAKGATVRGIPVGSLEGYDAMIRFIDANAIKPVIDARFAFDDAKAAYAAQLSPDLFGKIVIKISAE